MHTRFCVRFGKVSYIVYFSMGFCKNQNGFQRNRSTISQILTIRRILEGVRVKNLEATLLFGDFSMAFDSILRGKMEQILLAYSLLEETFKAIMILYKNTEVKVRSPDGDTDFFDIVARVLQGDISTLYLIIICLDYILQMSIDLCYIAGFRSLPIYDFIQKHTRGWRRVTFDQMSA